MPETWCYWHFLCMFASSRLIALRTPNCKSLWIKASAKWLNVNVNVKTAWRATLSLLSIFLSLILTHTNTHTHTHTPSYLYCVSIVCIVCIYFWKMSNNQRVFDDPSNVRGYMTAKISNALVREAKVRHILINLLPCLCKSLFIWHTICLFVGCSCCWSMMF